MFRRQCYNKDGNISGQRTDVAITDLESRAVSSHFEGHALNLTASGMLKQYAPFKYVMSTSHESITLKVFAPKTR